MKTLLRRFKNWLVGPDGWLIADDRNPEYSFLDEADGLGGGEAHALSVGEVVDWDEYWLNVKRSEKDDLKRYIAGDYPA